jgi:MFS family permease
MSLGSILGLPLIPVMIDRLGRKFGVVFGSVIVIISSAKQVHSRLGCSLPHNSFSASEWSLPFIATAAAPLLVTEISHAQDCALLCTFIGVSYSVGSFITSWVTLGTLKLQSNWAWRLPSLLQVVCSILVLCLIWFIPESPR